MLRLNVGCQDHYREGWTNIDVWEGVKADIHGDIRKLSFLPSSVDEIYCSNVLEHFSLEDARLVLHSFRTWLKSGGKLSLGVPNLEVLAKLIVEGTTVADELIMRWIYGTRGNTPDMRHCWGYTEKSLRKEMETAGFHVTGRFSGQGDDSDVTCNGLSLSLNLVVEK